MSAGFQSTMKIPSTAAHPESIGDDPLIRILRQLIRIAVRVLAVMMVGVIFWGVVETGLDIYARLRTTTAGHLNVSDILTTFGAFMAVLIAIEIFQNIVLYLRSETIHIKVVLATALVAVARKVIVFDFKETSPPYLFGTATVVLALGLVYWLIVVKGGPRQSEDERSDVDGP